jgi:hypothetical protein
MKNVLPEAGCPSEIEQLADKLSLRDLHVTLAPDGSNELILEVINFRLNSAGAPTLRAGRVSWRDGAFWWSRLADPERLPDLTTAVDRITASLRWSRQYSALTLPVQPDDS